MKKIIEFINDKRNFVPVMVVGISVVLTIVLLAICMVAFFGKNATLIDEESVSTMENEKDVKWQGAEPTPIEGRSKNEMRGVWIASVMNINFPSSSGLDFESMAKEIDKIVENSQKAGFNAIFFQVRPCSDALYKSDIFPLSQYLTGEQGVDPDGDFDPFEYLLNVHFSSLFLLLSFYIDTIFFIYTIYHIHNIFFFFQ